MYRSNSTIASEAYPCPRCSAASTMLPLKVPSQGLASAVLIVPTRSPPARTSMPSVNSSPSAGLSWLTVLRRNVSVARGGRGPVAWPSCSSDNRWSTRQSSGSSARSRTSEPAHVLISHLLEDRVRHHPPKPERLGEYPHRPPAECPNLSPDRACWRPPIG